MNIKDENKDWLNALSGKPNSAGDQAEENRASALRKAIQQHDASLEASHFDVETGLQKLKFRMRREGLSGNGSRQLISNRFVQFAMAASVVMVVGVMMRHYLPQEIPRNEGEVMRGTGNAQLVLAAEPEQRLKQLAAELVQLGIQYKVENKEGRIILKIQGIDPAKEDVANFLERNNIKPPVGADVVLDIRPIGTR